MSKDSPSLPDGGQERESRYSSKLGELQPEKFYLVTNREAREAFRNFQRLLQESCR